jgi:hypothetical protein
MSTGRTISIEELEELKEEYKKAVEDEVPLFSFKGEMIVTGFAKYVIEYFEGLKKDEK